MTAHSFTFDYEIDPLGQEVEVTATVRLPSAGHWHPNDPENNSGLEIDSVTLNGCDVNPDFIRVARKKRMPPGWGEYGFPLEPRWVPEWLLLTDLLREAAWERAEMEAA